jgi:hypothetical protein
VRIFEAQQTPRQIRMTISSQLEHERLLDAREPNAPADASPSAIVDLAAKNVLVKTPGHALLKREPLGQMATAIDISFFVGFVGVMIHCEIAQ